MKSDSTAPALRVAFAVALLAGPAAAAGSDTLGPWLQEPSRDGAVVVWETPTPSDGAVVVETSQGERRFASERGVHHEVRIAGLAPGRYRYRVDDGGPSAPTGELATAATGDRFTFLVIGDTRDADEPHRRLVAEMVREAPDLVLHLGDMVRAGADDDEWRRFFAIEAPLLASTPLYPALGNHELVGDPEASHFHRYFVLPDEPGGRFYRFRYGNALFIALDGNDSGSPTQARWLARSLEEADADPEIQHVFVFVHQPPFSDGVFCGIAPDESLWVASFEQHRRKLRVVFSGHEHNYERLARHGVRYVVTGGGGAYLIPRRDDCPAVDRAALRDFRAVHHYLRIRVRGGLAVMDAIAVDGQVIDSVRLDEPPAATPLLQAADFRARSGITCSISPSIHPDRLRRSSVKYREYSPSSLLAGSRASTAISDQLIPDRAIRPVRRPPDPRHHPEDAIPQ